FLQTVLVESVEDARKTIKFLNENNVGRVSVLVFPAKAQRRKEAKEIANQTSQIANLIGVSEDFAAVLEEVFPREMSANLVENFDEIKVGSDENYVNLAGDFNFGGKLFVGGKANSNEKNSSLLAFKRELRELEKQSDK